MKKIISFLKEVIAEWSDDKASRLAAALSYYTVFSLAPLLVIAVAIASLFFQQENVQQQLGAQISGLVGQQGSEAILEWMANANRPGETIFASIISIIILLFGASGVFGQLKEALNTIWDVREKPGGGIWDMVKDRFLSFTMVLGIGFLLLVSLVISAAISALETWFNGLLPGTEFLWQIISFLITLGVITLLFALIFKVLPDVEIAWRSVWLGAFVTALLFNIGKVLIGLYLGTASVSSTFGAAGSLVIVLLWVYYSAQILFLGAEFTQVYARRQGYVLKPAEGAERIDEPEAPEKSGAARVTEAYIYRDRPEAVPVTGQVMAGAIYNPQAAYYPTSRIDLTPRQQTAAPPPPPMVMPVLGLAVASVAGWLFAISRLVFPEVKTEVQTRSARRRKKAKSLRSRINKVLKKR